ncbi:hypothetical protein ACP70R_027325 [Stipagrostis hirtigluma subsp. patula]
MGRKYVHLVVCDCTMRVHTLHRINMRRFFSGAGAGPGAWPESCHRLPRATIRFRCSGRDQMAFFPVGSRKVVAVDSYRRAVVYDARSRTVRAGPALHAPKQLPLAARAGANVYVLDQNPDQAQPCFEALRCGRGADDGLSWEALPPPPYVEAASDGDAFYVRSCAVVGGASVWVSTERLGTHSFDTRRRAWRKEGDWMMPFQGRAEYVPEFGLWFGLSPCPGNHLCAADLTAASSPPAIVGVWEDLTPRKRRWELVDSHLVYLGSAKFCIASFFRRPSVRHIDGKCVAVLTAVEVQRCAQGLRAVKRKSRCYRNIRNPSWNWTF